MAAIPRPQLRSPNAAESPLIIETLRHSEFDLWDAFVASHPEGTVFHTSAWLRSVETAFGHEPLHLVARRGLDWAGVLPMFCVRSWLAGTMLVSVPYAVYGGPLTWDEPALYELQSVARSEAKRVRARFIDFRSPKRCFEGLTNVDRYVTFRRELPASTDEMDRWLPRKARAVARNAVNKYKLSLRFDVALLREVYRLYSASMKRLGSINYPYRFIRELVGRTGLHHFVSVVFDGKRPVAGLVSFLYRQTIMPYFVGCSDDGKRMGAYHLMYQEIARRAVELGCHTFDFGRSRIDNRGACEFKRLQGFEPMPLGYQCDVLPGCTAPNLSPSNPRFAWARRIWPMLPTNIASCLGAALSRHIPG